MNDRAVLTPVPTPEPSPIAKVVEQILADPERAQAMLLRDAAARAVYRVIEILKSDLDRAKDSWKKKLTDATQAYREQMRDEARLTWRASFEKLKAKDKLTDRDKQNLVSICEHYYAACDGLEVHDDVKSDGDTDKKAKKKRIEKFEAALRALQLQGKSDDGKQQALFEVPTAVGSMTEDTKEVVYSALLHLDNDKAPLDEMQRALLVELGSAGVKVTELNINAAEAVEQDVGDDEDEADDAGSDDETDVPF